MLPRFLHSPASVFLAGVGAFFFIAAGSTEAAKPNVILVMADDLGWGDVGFNGNKIIRTPHLDAMASNGLTFSRFYSAGPVCSPTRGSCLTGRHPFRYGIVTANAGHMKAGEQTLAELLRAEGYATGHFGKWHLGTLTKTVHDANRGGPRGVAHYATPPMNGFDVCFSTESKVPTFAPLRVPQTFGPGASRRIGWDAMKPDEAWEHYGTRYWDEDGREVKDALLDDDSKEIVSRALPFIEKAVQEEKPFFAVVWFHAPHLPVVASERQRKAYKDYPLHERNYYGCVTALDEQVGRLRSSLRQLGVAENTMLWFCSDNGPEGKAKDPGSAGGFRGRKRSLYEGGVRVPALLEWPAIIGKSRTTAYPAVTSDYLPTVMDALGRTEAVSLPLDGVSLMPLIRGEVEKRVAPIGFQTKGVVAWHEGPLKLVFQVKGKDGLELYDLAKDPSESRNLAEEMPERAAEMQAAAKAWQESCARSSQGLDYGASSD